jgi:hypothetical protein
MSRQPIPNSAPPAPSAKTSFSIRQSLIAIALGGSLSGLGLAIAQTSNPSQLIQSVSPAETIETLSSNAAFLAQASISLQRLSQLTRNVSLASTSLASSASFGSQESRPASHSSQHFQLQPLQRASRFQGMRYVWNRRWLPARNPASTTSFSTLDQTWFSWYRWWQLQAVKSRSSNTSSNAK